MPATGVIFQKKLFFIKLYAKSKFFSTLRRLPFYVRRDNLEISKGAIFMPYINGKIIKELREKKKLTQKQLGEIILVSDKTISKWETEKGLPDITLLEPLSKALGVSVAELLAGESITNQNRAGNIKKIKFYVCPVCGNVVFSLGEGAFYCCGIILPQLMPEKPDYEHEFFAEHIENDIFIRFSHPMTKEHYISFAAYITYDGVSVKKLYPEQEAEIRFNYSGKGKIVFFCNKDGLFEFSV